jgi:hypothetical protein
VNELVILAAVLSVIVMGLVLSPFFYGSGGSLQDASASDNVEVLEARQSAILKRWIQDEDAAERGEISKTEWSQRQRYLTSRYVDVARRIHWIQVTATPDESRAQSGGEV